MPAPMGTPATTCAVQGTEGFELQPNQNRPAGKSTAMGITGGRRSSGRTVPLRNFVA
ncbi:hypothetical protein PENSUB_6551 [Penicillium subrubescens]|uniref:Uncharacterized protein n=1 Tax=Penicillium subrubescens TaxID=1316194 RepID=A0A1Q5U052_9EURO|nr:hypothetical protein PENSUB_6551 [Penicillium subrubescens]